MEFIKTNKETIVLVLMGTVLVIEQILPLVTNVKANSTLQAIQGIAKGIVGLFKKK